MALRLDAKGGVIALSRFSSVVNAKVARASSWQIVVKARDFCMVYARYPHRFCVRVEGDAEAIWTYANRAFDTAGVSFLAPEAYVESSADG